MPTPAEVVLVFVDDEGPAEDAPGPAQAEVAVHVVDVGAPEVVGLEVPQVPGVTLLVLTRAVRSLKASRTIQGDISK